MSVGIQVTAASLSKSNLRGFRRHKQMVNNHNDPESLLELSKISTIMNLLDQIPTHLREMLGLSKVGLYYVIQYYPTSPIMLPPLQPNLIWSLETSVMTDELVAYTPHTG